MNIFTKGWYISMNLFIATPKDVMNTFCSLQRCQKSFRGLWNAFFQIWARSDRLYQRTDSCTNDLDCLANRVNPWYGMGNSWLSQVVYIISLSFPHKMVPWWFDEPLRIIAGLHLLRPWLWHFQQSVDQCHHCLSYITLRQVIWESEIRRCSWEVVHMLVLVVYCVCWSSVSTVSAGKVVVRGLVWCHKGILQLIWCHPALYRTGRMRLGSCNKQQERGLWVSLIRIHIQSPYFTMTASLVQALCATEGMWCHLGPADCN